MFTTVAYSANQAGTVAFANLAAVPDQHIRVIGNRIYVGDLNQIIGVGAAVNTGMYDAYLDAPSLRRVALLDIDPTSGGQRPSPDTVHWFPTTPLPLMKNEGLEFLCGGTANAAVQRTAVVMLADGAVAPVGGEIFTIRARTTIASVAGTWVNGAMVLRQTLPVGRYQLVGAAVCSNTGVAFRFVPIGEGHRPGGYCSRVPTGRSEYHIQRRGGLGVWFEFDSVTPPTLELLCHGVDAGQWVTLDLVKIS